MILSLVNTLALLLSLVFLYGYYLRWIGSKTPSLRVGMGVLFGLAAVFSMSIPVVFAQGIIFDPRSVVISLAGFFGGWLAAVPAALIGIAYRLWLGGTGAVAGSLVILGAAAVGTLFHVLERDESRVPLFVRLLMLGLVAHAVAVFGLLVLPVEVRWAVVSSLAVPFFVLYPPATAVMGTLLAEVEKRHATELRERQSEELLHAIGNASPDTVMVVEESGRVLELFPGTDSLRDVSRRSDEIRLETLFPSEAAGRLSVRVGDAIASRSEATLEYFVPSARGGAYFEARIAPMKTAIDGARAAVIVARDITERKRNERALTESTRQLGERVKEITLLYRVAERLADNSEPLDRCLAAIVDYLPPAWQFPEHASARIRMTGSEYLSANFYESSVALHAPIHVYGQQVGAVSVYYDDGVVADGVDPFLEEEREVLNTIAKEIASFAERRETEQALVRSQKMESIGQMVAGIAHDFNNILAIVQGSVQMLRRLCGDDPELARQIERALAATGRGANLARNLLDFSRQQVGELVPVELGEAILEYRSLIERTLTPRIELDLTPVGMPVTVKMVKEEFQDALLNLVLNARDAMPDGGSLRIEVVDIEVRADDAGEFADLAPGDYVEVRVSDTGMGMMPEALERAVEPFYSTKPAGKGTGLGLSMVNGFVRRHRGMLKLESTLGAGTTVRLLLPRSVDIVEQVERSVPDSEALPGGTESILVVDDEPDLLELALELLADLGYETLSARNGAEALEILDSASTLDMLLTDVVMPGGIGGYELAARAQQQRPGIAVVLVSGNPGEIGSSAEGERPSFPLVRKPYSDRDLATAIRRALDESE